MQVREIIALPSHVQISVRSMSCTGNAIASEKSQKIEIFKYYGNFSISKFPAFIVAGLHFFRTISTK